MPNKIFVGIVRKLIGTVVSVITPDPAVALTFDDGPDPNSTPRILEILERYGARGTFFVVGEAAKRYPELIQRIAEGGHAIGNHSWDHASFPLIDGRERRRQLRKCADAVKPYGAKLFRPPYGHQNFASRLDALLLGYRVIMYDIAADDWCGGTAATIVTQIEQKIHPGCIIVLHDGLFDASEQSHFNRSSMLESVEMVLSRLCKSYRFVTVPKLLSSGKAAVTLWNKAPDLADLNGVQRQAGAPRRYQTARGLE